MGTRGLIQHVHCSRLYFLLTDLDIKFPLKDEFILVKIDHKQQHYEEIHMAILKTEEEKKQESKKRNNLYDMNIVLINFDSQSHANIQRQWTRTYDYFTKDPNTIIMKVRDCSIILG